LGARNFQHDWSSVLVIGEHKRNPDEDRSIATLVQLAGYAREVLNLPIGPLDPMALILNPIKDVLQTQDSNSVLKQLAVLD
jgi:hypothetical protein